MAAMFTTAFFVVLVSTQVASQSSTANLEALLRDHFSANRHHVTNLPGKMAARDFIYDTWQVYGMQVFLHNFLTANSQYTGANVVGLWPGRYTGTAADRPVLLSAHYDTMRDTPGVDDNGSGLAALLESARLITSQPCLQDYTVVFTAFDLEEWEEATNPGSACSSLGCGSREFVNNILLPYLTQTGVSPADFRGAVVMDTIMNYNNSQGAQVIPAEQYFRVTPGLEDAYTSISNEGFRGNFLATISRDPYDSPVLNTFNRRWAGLSNQQYKTQSLKIPIKDIVRDMPGPPYGNVYQALIRGDFYNFWAGNANLTAVFLTDTGDLRGGMQGCYHHGCDDLSRVTPERLTFLQKTTNAVTATLWELANGATCTDPTSAVPKDFKTGLHMTGNLVLPYVPNDFRFTVTSYSTTGVVMATFSNDTLSLKLTGRFDDKTLQLTLRLSEPTKAFPGQIDPLQTMAWVMSGQVMTAAKGNLFYTGEVQGLFGPQGGAVSFAFLSSSGNDTSGQGVSTLSIIFFVSSGILFVLAVALYASTICKARTLDAPFTRDQSGTC
ncbi:Hypp3369 [Branchiostoma lanceolatum]|uniref:Hypp3369 protein n=1 Tax=Branchiostoma lanceolatum TaxID=7740 RepID=A0A8J9ZZJ1_BRALA|nr:Hypp3369 [Branchiostoma lanceolatum]